VQVSRLRRDTGGIGQPDAHAGDCTAGLTQETHHSFVASPQSVGY
jgi:hypothetical protein